jgi:hypothetical protein
MTKFGENFDVPSENMPDAFGINNERAEDLNNVLRKACKNAAERHGKLEDTDLDHVISDIMREVDSKIKITSNEKDLLLIQLGSNLGNISDFIASMRGMREMERMREKIKELFENLSDEDKKAVEQEEKRMRKFKGRLFRQLANVLDPVEKDPTDHDFSEN